MACACWWWHAYIHMRVYIVVHGVCLLTQPVRLLICGDLPRFRKVVTPSTQPCMYVCMHACMHVWRTRLICGNIPGFRKVGTHLYSHISIYVCMRVRTYVWIIRIVCSFLPGVRKGIFTSIQPRMYVFMLYMYVGIFTYIQPRMYVFMVFIQLICSCFPGSCRGR